MKATTDKSVSLDQVRQMRERGELVYDPNAPEGDALGGDFWVKAEIRFPKKTEEKGER